MNPYRNKKLDCPVESDKIHQYAGIYIVKCMVNGKIYIGQTTNMQKRRDDWLHRLKSGNIKNEYLLEDVKKFGYNNFCFEERFTIPGGMTLRELEIMENAFIHSYKSNNRSCGYNIANQRELVAKNIINKPENYKNGYKEGYCNAVCLIVDNIAMDPNNNLDSELILLEILRYIEYIDGYEFAYMLIDKLEEICKNTGNAKWIKECRQQ